MLSMVILTQRLKYLDEQNVTLITSGQRPIIKNLTVCFVWLEILPILSRSATKQYGSEKFQEVQDNSTNSQQKLIPEF